MFNFKNKKLIPYVVVVFVFLVCAGFLPVFRPLALEILGLPLKFFTLVSDEVKGIILYHKNYTENRILRRDVDLLRQKLNTADELRLENERLKKILSFKEKAAFRVIAAAVIGRSADNWSSGIIINKGSSSGIRKGFVVISYLGLVGRVVETSQHVSKVMLLSDSSFSVSSIDQRSRQEGLVAGTLGSTLVMKYLPKDADVLEQDIVVTSGLTETYPKGVIIGTVVDVGEELSGLSRYAVIKPAVNLSSLEEVLIIIP